MKKILAFIALSLLLFSCEEDNGYREVYMVVDVDANNDSEILEAYFYFNSNNVGEYLTIYNAPEDKTYETQTYSYPVGTNLVYSRTSDGFDFNTSEYIYWAKTRVRIYSDNKKILDETYNVGDLGDQTFTNLILD